MLAREVISSAAMRQRTRLCLRVMQHQTPAFLGLLKRERGTRAIKLYSSTRAQGPAKPGEFVGDDALQLYDTVFRYCMHTRWRVANKPVMAKSAERAILAGLAPREPREKLHELHSVEVFVFHARRLS